MSALRYSGRISGNLAPRNGFQTARKYATRPLGASPLALNSSFNVQQFIHRSLITEENTISRAHQYRCFSSDVVQRPDKLPESRTWITDPTATLSDWDKEEISSIIRELFSKYGIELSVYIEEVVPQSINSPRDRAVDIFNTLGIGSKERNNGILVYMVLADRRIEIIVGSGLEKILPNDWVRNILELYAVPRILREGKGPGIIEACNRMADTIWQHSSKDPKQMIDWAHRDPIARAPKFISDGSKFREEDTTGNRDDGHREKNSGTNKNGIYQFGAFATALAGWLFYRNREAEKQSKTCKYCSHYPMEEFSADVDMSGMTPCEITEIEIGSVLYRSFLCPQCHKISIVKQEVPFKQFQRFERCFHCDCRSIVVDKPIELGRKADGTSSQLIRSECRLCGKRDEYRRTVNTGSASDSNAGVHGGGSTTGGGAGASF